MQKIELLIVILLTIGHSIVTEFNITGPLRVISGFVFLSFLPGYVWLSVFFVEKFENKGLLTHAVVSIPVSLAIICTLGLITNYIGVGRDTTSNLVWLSVYILLFAFISYFRRANITLPNRNLCVSILIIGSVVILFTVNLPPINSRESSDITYLSLYAVNNKSLTDPYPRWVKTGNPVEILVGVEYRGNSDQRFTLVPSHNSNELLSVSPGETWKKRFQITVDKPGLHRVTWKLFIEGNTNALREICIWLNAF